MLRFASIVSVASCITSVFGVQNLKVSGNEFVNNVTSSRFQMLGIAYQPGGTDAFGQGSDPLSNGTACLRDAALMQMLGTNLIRVYNVDPSLNHDDCVSIFNAVGIYLLLDVNSPLPNESLDPGNLQDSYNSDYLKRVFSVIEAFDQYPNLLGFFSGNEVLHTAESFQKAPPYIRAVTRDMNNYIAKHSPRLIPVGYSAADVSTELVDSWAYLSCAINGKPDPSRIEFFGLNSYSWCGPTSKTANYQASDYDQIIDNFADTSIPIFFSEYGCNKVEPRVWDEVSVIYGNMTSVMSGGIVYEFYQEDNNYGLVDIYQNATAQTRVDYDNLQKAYAKLDSKALQNQNSSGTAIQPPVCGKNLIKSSSFDASFNLPNPPEGATDLINKGVSSPNQGKLVDVKQTQVSQAVYGSDGKQIQNLAIKPLPSDQSNSPQGVSNSGGKKKSASSQVQAQILSVAASLGFVAVVAVLF